MTHPRFTVRNEAFTCLNCGKEVPPAKKTCRNHCPFCLTSRHVDISPGDRENPCGGKMDLIDYDGVQPSEIILIFRCSRCQAIVRNRTTDPHDPVPDSLDKILASKIKK